MRTSKAVEIQHRGGARLEALIAGMTLEQELAFWREQEALLDQRMRALREEKPEYPADASPDAPAQG